MTVRHTSEELYILSVLAHQDTPQASELYQHLTAGQSRLVRRPGTVERVAMVFFILLTVAVVGVVIALLAGLAKNLLQLVW